MKKQAVKSKSSVVRARDINGTELKKGDTVVTSSGDLTATIHDISVEMGTAFVELRPMYQATRRGVWHAADRVVRTKAARSRS